MRRAKHPRSVDDERTFLARLSLAGVIGFFVFLVAVAAALSVGVMALLTFLTSGGMLTDPMTLAVDSFYAILGGEISETFRQVPYSRAIEILLKFLSILLPSLLLGAVVYKMTRPRRRMTIFRQTINLDPDTESLEGTFYIATRLSVYDLQINTYARYYKTHLDDGAPNPYPLKTVQLSQRTIPQPFSFVPTRVAVPARVARSVEDYDALVESTALANGEAPSLLFLVENDRVSRVHVDGESIDPRQGDTCRLSIIVSGVVPEAQFQLIETEGFDLRRDVKIEAAPEFPSEFRPDRKTYVTTNWDAFGEL
ncbi:hypothetical protein [Oricola sp.]|uniref:hypothetical protein n=1 Tax=Oricola sp. TaxID=1979950 RepID=UPI0025D59246|nr:hypothetical protein [Oricola sp.]MCI5074274.1 hypothetical protein [Oricola sp.]